MATKVALQVRPAHLALLGVKVLIAVPAVRDDDPRIRADQLAELLAVAVLGDLEDRGAGAGQRPQRATVAGGPPSPSHQRARCPGSSTQSCS